MSLLFESSSWNIIKIILDIPSIHKIQKLKSDTLCLILTFQLQNLIVFSTKITFLLLPVKPKQQIKMMMVEINSVLHHNCNVSTLIF